MCDSLTAQIQILAYLAAGSLSVLALACYSTEVLLGHAKHETNFLEGRNYICSSRLGLIRWDIIQHVKAVHHKGLGTVLP